MQGLCEGVGGEGHNRIAQHVCLQVQLNYGYGDHKTAFRNFFTQCLRILWRGRTGARRMLWRRRDGVCCDACATSTSQTRPLYCRYAHQSRAPWSLLDSTARICHVIFYMMIGEFIGRNLRSSKRRRIKELYANTTGSRIYARQHADVLIVGGGQAEETRMRWGGGGDGAHASMCGGTAAVISAPAEIVLAGVGHTLVHLRAQDSLS